MADLFTRFEFPPYTECTFEKPPLYEAIIQVKFPPNLRIASVPADFHERLKTNWPNVTAQPKSVPGGMIRATYAFAGEIPDKAFTLEVDTLTMQSGNYGGWVNFRKLFEEVLEALDSAYSPQYFTRVGLRFQNLISRSEYGMAGEPWTKLVRPDLLGPLGSTDVAGTVFEHQNRTSVRLQTPANGNAHLSAKLINATSDGRDEMVLVLDGDFYVDGTKVHSREVPTILDELHHGAHGYFRWAVTPALLERMGPRPRTS